MRHKLTFQHIGTALYLVCALCLISCTQDNVHVPDEGNVPETWETYTASYPGILSSTVPLMEESMQGPVKSQMTIRISNFHSAHSGYVDIYIPQFSINDPFVLGLMGKAIEIGEMEIDDVEFAAFPSGGGYFRKDKFEVQAGEYTVRGSLQGELSSAGSLTFALHYKPGAMPFEVQSEFDTNQ